MDGPHARGRALDVPLKALIDSRRAAWAGRRRRSAIVEPFPTTRAAARTAPLDRTTIVHKGRHHHEPPASRTQAPRATPARLRVVRELRRELSDG